MTVTESIRVSTNLCYFSIMYALMICYFMILRSVTNLHCVTCYKLDPDCAFIVYYLLLCAYAVMHRWWTVRSILSADRGVNATCFIVFDSLSFLSSCCFFIFFFCIIPVCYPFAMSSLYSVVSLYVVCVASMLCFGLVTLYRRCLESWL